MRKKTKDCFKPRIPLLGLLIVVVIVAGVGLLFVGSVLLGQWQSDSNFIVVQKRCGSKYLIRAWEGFDTGKVYDPNPVSGNQDNGISKTQYFCTVKDAQNAGYERLFNGR